MSDASPTEAYPICQVRRISMLSSGGVWGNDPDGLHDSLVVRSTDQTAEGQWNRSSPATRSLSSQERSIPRLAAGDLVITKSSGSARRIGKTTIVDDSLAQEGAYHGNFMQRVRLRSTEWPRYFWYVFNSAFIRAQIALHSTSSTGLANLTGSTIGELKVPRPPLDEQRAIADYLDRKTTSIDTLIEEQRRLIALLRERRQSMIDYAILGSDSTDLALACSRNLERLDRLATVLISTVDKHTSTDEHPVRLCNYMDVYTNSSITCYIEYMNATDNAKEIDKFQLRRGDTLLTKDSESPEDIGMTAYVDYQASDLVCGYHLAILRPALRDVDPAYLYWATTSRFVQRQWASLARGVTRFGLRYGDIGKASIPMHEKGVQERVAGQLAERTAAIDELVAEAESFIELARERRSALISAAVTGQINVRDMAA